MSDRAFIDTNVLVYAVGDEEPKRQRAEALLLSLEQVVVSAQVLSEFVNVSLREQLLERAALEAVVDGYLRAYEVMPVEGETIARAFGVLDRYGYAWWDSAMLASALVARCTVVYTEDLQDGQLIEGRLRIVNPFAPS